MVLSPSPTSDKFRGTPVQINLSAGLTIINNNYEVNLEIISQLKQNPVAKTLWYDDHHSELTWHLLVSLRF